MDQSFSTETSNGLLIGMVIPASGRIQLSTGSISALP
jgi:hypothetical protein